MNMYLHEFKYYKKSTIIWTISLLAIIILFMAMFPTFSSDTVQIQKIMEGFPEEIRKALGFSSLDLSTLLGFYGMIFNYIILCGAIQAMNIGLSILSAESREKTADFLLSKPVTRQQIVTSKLLAAITSVLITDVIYSIAAILMAQAVKTDDFSMKAFILISLTLLFVQLIFIALGVIISVVMKRIKSVLSISLGVVFALYIINWVASSIDDVKIKYITPFGYFDSSYIIANGTYEVSFIIVSVAIIVVSIVASYILYAKKDIAGV
ncbi:ABC transporter permease subunit [Clostridium sediminicola]|uniref:ABC transporter permease subunit n=1 Tax=Clostridium sediminicola TaxID=3114879 RepID=UPI0031F1C653